MLDERWRKEPTPTGWRKDWAPDRPPAVAGRLFIVDAPNRPQPRGFRGVVATARLLFRARPE